MADSKDDRIEALLALSEGAIVGRYRIIRKLGSGGMADVYLAEDSQLKRPAALKFLSLMLGSDPTCGVRFTREAQAAAKLNHPNIITIYEVGEFKGRPYMAMEFLEGETLRQIIEGKNLSRMQTLDIGIQLCQGLQEAHSAGIIHRDIKPANVSIDKKGRAKLLDFGLAVVEGCEHLTKTGATIGTISYMSPEQVLGRELDGRSDIFSLGVLLYEMLTGTLPFHGDHEAVMMYAIANEPHEQLNKFVIDIPEEFQQVIDKCLEKDRDKRYQDCASVMSDLEKIRDKYSGHVSTRSISIEPVDSAHMSIAVLYFEDYTGDENIKWLSKGLPHMLISNLERSASLTVVGYQRLFDILRALGQENAAQISPEIATQVCRKAGVNTMILGGIFKFENKIRIDYAIQEVESGRLIYSGKTAGKEPFGLADRLGAQIREQLGIAPPSLSRIKSTSSPKHSTQAFRYYLEGLDYYYQMYWDEATASFEKALRIDSTFAMAYYGLALIKKDEKALEAKDAISKALEHADKLSHKEELYVRSLHAIIFGDFEKAVVDLKAITQHYKNEKDALFWLGLFQRTKFGKSDEAIKYLTMATELDPHLKAAYNELVYAYDQVKNFEKSVWAADKYISLAPDEANPHDTKGDLYANNAKLDEAIACYQTALEVKPDFHQAMQKLGLMCIYKRDYALAQKCFQGLSVCSNRGRRAEGRTCLAWVPIYQGKFRQALSMLDNGLIADSIENIEDAQNANKHLFKASIHAEMKAWDKAIAEALTGNGIWHKAYPQDPVFGRHYLAQLYANMGDLNQARLVVQEIKADTGASNRPSPIYLYADANTRYAEGDLPGAYAGMEAAANAMPHFYIHFMYAKLCLEIGKLDLAVRELEKMLSTYNINRLAWTILAVKAYYLLATAYMQSGWTDKAIEKYREFLDIWKDADSPIEEIVDAQEKIKTLKAKQ